MSPIHTCPCDVSDLLRESSRPIVMAINKQTGLASGIRTSWNRDNIELEDDEIFKTSYVLSVAKLCTGDRPKAFWYGHIEKVTRDANGEITDKSPTDWYIEAVDETFATVWGFRSSNLPENVRNISLNESPAVTDFKAQLMPYGLFCYSKQGQAFSLDWAGNLLGSFSPGLSSYSTALETTWLFEPYYQNEYCWSFQPHAGPEGLECELTRAFTREAEISWESGVDSWEDQLHSVSTPESLAAVRLPMRTRDNTLDKNIWGLAASAENNAFTTESASGAVGVAIRPRGQRIRNWRNFDTYLDLSVVPSTSTSDLFLFGEWIWRVGPVTWNAEEKYGGIYHGWRSADGIGTSAVLCITRGDVVSAVPATIAATTHSNLGLGSSWRFPSMHHVVDYDSSLYSDSLSYYQNYDNGLSWVPMPNGDILAVQPYRLRQYVDEHSYLYASEYFPMNIYSQNLIVDTQKGGQKGYVHVVYNYSGNPNQAGGPLLDTQSFGVNLQGLAPWVTDSQGYAHTSHVSWGRHIHYPRIKLDTLAVDGSTEQVDFSALDTDPNDNKENYPDGAGYSPGTMVSPADKYGYVQQLSGGETLCLTNAQDYSFHDKDNTNPSGPGYKKDPFLHFDVVDEDYQIPHNIQLYDRDANLLWSAGIPLIFKTPTTSNNPFGLCDCDTHIFIQTHHPDYASSDYESSKFLMPYPIINRDSDNFYTVQDRLAWRTRSDLVSLTESSHYPSDLIAVSNARYPYNKDVTVDTSAAADTSHKLDTSTANPDPYVGENNQFTFTTNTAATAGPTYIGLLNEGSNDPSIPESDSVLMQDPLLDFNATYLENLYNIDTNSWSGSVYPVDAWFAGGTLTYVAHPLFPGLWLLGLGASQPSGLTSKMYPLDNEVILVLGFRKFQSGTEIGSFSMTVQGIMPASYYASTTYDPDHEGEKYVVSSGSYVRTYPGSSGDSELLVEGLSSFAVVFYQQGDPNQVLVGGSATPISGGNEGYNYVFASSNQVRSEVSYALKEVTYLNEDYEEEHAPVYFRDLVSGGVQNSATSLKVLHFEASRWIVSTQ